MKIEIVDEKVYERTVTPKDGRPPVKFRTQKAFAFLEDSPYPKEFNLQLWEHPPFPVGHYSLLDLSFKIDKYGNLGLKSNLSLGA